MGVRKDRAKKILGYEPDTLNRLAEAIISLINYDLKGNKVVGFAWDIVYSDSVSNTHSCPDDGVTNWGWQRTENNLPCGYPGFSGRVWIRFDKSISGFGSDTFAGSLSHPGTGGAGSYNGPWAGINSMIYQHRGNKNLPKKSVECYSWDYKIFADDWPLIKDTVGQELTMLELKGKGSSKIRHVYKWDDPEILTSDNQFADTVKALQVQSMV